MNAAQKLADLVLKAALDANASDIHFYPFSTHTDIYFRIHGKRIFYKKILNGQYHLLLTYLKFTSGMDIGETRKPQNGTLEHMHTQKYFLRLSTLPVSQMESLAVRILPQDEKLPLKKLFLFPNQLLKIKKWIKNQAGIILITGPTGSGKTTLLYTLLETIIKEKPYQTITLEDPIEKELDHILQVQVNEKAGITYQTGLKAALRHDPDIIMIGEIRDEYTAKFAFEASLTGHLVLSTLHAKDAQGTIERLEEMGISKTDLRQTLIAVASIQLIPIVINDKVSRRAAILELLSGDVLEGVLQGKNADKFPEYQTFDHLRKKAYAYGFITEAIYNETKT